MNDSPKSAMETAEPANNKRVNAYSRLTYALYAAIYLYSAYTTHERDDRSNNLRCMLVIFLFLTMISLSERKRQPFDNWLPNIVKGLTVSYALFLIFITQHNYKQAKYIWNTVEPEVSHEQAKKYFATWQTNCDISAKNLYNKLDRYSASHFIGWIFHALLIRDYWTMHFWSILTELVELLFGEVIPPLAECWWDQVFCDMLLTNLPGMIVGMLIIKKLGWREFDWLGRKAAKSWKEWEIWTNHKKILALFLLLLGYSIQFLGCFFVPNAFHTSPTSDFSGIRLLIWFFVGYGSFKELYDYSCEPVDHSTTVGGHYSQIGMTVMLCEITIIIKHYYDSVILFNGSFSIFKKTLWPLSITIYFLWYVYARTLIKSKKTIKNE